MTKRVRILNGPNLGRLGTREPDVYGSVTHEALSEACVATGRELGLDVEVQQTDAEATYIGWLHECADGGVEGVLLNPAGWTHTSVAIRDAAAQLTRAVHRSALVEPVGTRGFSAHLIYRWSCHRYRRRVRLGLLSARPAGHRGGDLTMTFSSRRSRLAASLPETVDAMLVTNIVNVRYLTGFTGSNAAVVVCRDAAEVFATDGRYVTQAAREVPDIETLDTRELAHDLIGWAAGRGLGRLGDRSRAHVGGDVRGPYQAEGQPVAGALHRGGGAVACRQGRRRDKCAPDRLRHHRHGVHGGAASDARRRHGARGGLAAVVHDAGRGRGGSRVRHHRRVRSAQCDPAPSADRSPVGSG